VPLADVRIVRTDSVRLINGKGGQARYNVAIMTPARSPIPSRLEEERRFTRPFFWLVAVSLIITYGYTVIAVPEVREPLRFVVFTALIGLSGGLHWMFTNLRVTLRGVVPYLIGQGVLSFVLTVVGQNISLGIGLYMMMIGEALGVLGINWRGLLAMAFYLALSAINFVLLLSPAQIMAWVLPIIPTAVFVILFVWMFQRQNEAREAAQALARELDAANRQLTDYAAEVEDLTLINERQRMARELHDTLSQGLAGLILQLEAVDSHLSRGRADKAQSIVQQAMDRARTTLAEARRVIDDLRASDRDPIDLATAIQAEVDRFSAATGLPCEVDVTLPLEVPTAISDNVLRMISEALTNVARHASASHVQLQLRSIDQLIELTVRDNGCGFDPAAIDQMGHYGLIGLQERARALGGTLSIDSQSGRGTTLRIILPSA
jgi:NarL family two-component system sensor histidine kinase YdfH